MSTKRIVGWLCTLLVIALPAVVAMAGGDGVESPREEETASNWSPPWYAILFTLVFVAAIAVLAFKRAKRTSMG